MLTLEIMFFCNQNVKGGKKSTLETLCICEYGTVICI